MDVKCLRRVPPLCGNGDSEHCTHIDSSNTHRPTRLQPFIKVPLQVPLKTHFTYLVGSKSGSGLCPPLLLNVLMSKKYDTARIISSSPSPSRSAMVGEANTWASIRTYLRVEETGERGGREAGEEGESVEVRN